MKIIDLLNKIANGEIERGYKFKYRNKIVTMGYLLDNYLFLEILNDEIEIIEDTPKEEKKIPDDLYCLFTMDYNDDLHEVIKKSNINFRNINEKLGKILDYLDYLKSKGDE